MVPFVEVLLHSWMDMHRVSEDREINHHGTIIKLEDTDSKQVGLDLYSTYSFISFTGI